MTTTTTTTQEALSVLRKAMKKDYGFAWSWHCNVASAAQDAGAPHKESNEQAAVFMFRAFGVDTRKEPTGVDNDEIDLPDILPKLCRCE